MIGIRLAVALRLPRARGIIKKRILGIVALGAAGCLPANVAKIFYCNPGESVRTIQVSSGGTLHVMETT
jgi:hypothetical protein